MSREAVKTVETSGESDADDKTTLIVTLTSCLVAAFAVAGMAVWYIARKVT